MHESWLDLRADDIYQGVTPTPDRVFMGDLKRMDKKLDCIFFRTHSHFVITYDRATGDKAPLFMVKNNINGGFRQPDQRDLKTLWDGDCAKPGENMTHKLNKWAYTSECYKRKKHEKAKQAIAEATMDDRRQIVPAMARAHNIGGKNNSIFRRITHKPKGKVF
jgi:hypothetical protein